MYTGIKCPKCPEARRVVREVVKEVGLKEGKDFVEKLIDGDNLKPGSAADIEGDVLNVYSSVDEIKKTPAVVANSDVVLEALTHQIASTPGIVVDDEVVSTGEVPSKEELIRRLK